MAIDTLPSSIPAPVAPSRVSQLEALPCELCGSDERTLIAWHTDLQLGGDIVYTMHTCHGCGAVYQHPRPTPAAMHQHYPPTYQPYRLGVRSDHPLYRPMRRYGLAKRCRAITRHVRSPGPKQLLDIGCATGDFLTEMRRQPGWSVLGLEPGSVAAHYAHTVEELTVVIGTLNYAPWTTASFDALTFWDVLEHVHDPRAVIAAAARLLRPGGVLVINHPNLDSLDRQLFGHFWLGYELPRHLYLFPTQLLRDIMAEHDLYEVERRCLYGSYSAFVSSLVFVLNAYLGIGRISRWTERLLLSMPLRLLAAPLFSWIDHQQRGCNVTVVFQKARPSPQ